LQSPSSKSSLNFHLFLKLMVKFKKTQELTTVSSMDSYFAQSHQKTRVHQAHLITLWLGKTEKYCLSQKTMVLFTFTISTALFKDPNSILPVLELRTFRCFLLPQVMQFWFGPRI